MGQLQAVAATLDSLGFQIVAIAPDPPEKLRETRDRAELNFVQLSDVDFQAAKDFGVAFKPDGKRALPVPSVFVVGPDQRIFYQHVDPNYRVRLDPDVLIAMVRTVARQFEPGR